MKSILISLSIFGLSIACPAQSAFDKRFPAPKKPDNGIPVGNATTISGKNSPYIPVKGRFPLSFTLDKKFKEFNIEWNESGEIAVSITPKAKLPLETTPVSLNGNLLPGQVLNRLNDLKKLLRLDNPSAELILVSFDTDELGMTHLKFRQHLEGTSVIGGQIIVHVKEKAIESITNYLYPTPVVLPIKYIDPEIVIKSIIQDIPYEQLNDIGNSLLNSKRRLIVEKVIFHPGRDPESEKYCYRIEYRPNLFDWWEFIADASTGAIIDKTYKTCSIDGPRTAAASDLNSISRTINTYQAGSTYYLLDVVRPMFNQSLSTLPNDGVGVIWTLDANFTHGNSLFNNTSSNNTWTNKAAVSAHFISSVAYEYYRTTHGRNSISGTGGNVVSIINVNEEDGSKMDNAYWNGEMMFYGNGDVAFKPLAGALDVGGHELTHGVVQNTANLEYKGQSGAINESMADVFGSLIDRDDWQIGEDVTKTSFIPSGALRDLSDPHNGRSSLGQAGYQPKTMSEYYTGTQDNEGVHINSGIPNHAYFLIANNIGKDKAEKIYYRSLTFYLTSQSQFIDLRRAIIKSAEDLFGNGSGEATAAINAFNTVGIYGYNGSGMGGTTGNGNGEVILTQNPGTEFIVSFDTDPGTASTIYTSNTSGGNFVAKSQTDIKRKCSVTDDGTTAYFVSKDDSRIKSISLVGSVNESYVSAVGDEFDNVAISKNGKHLSATTTLVDSSIYVYDFGLKQWMQFKLYNPTFSDGVKTGGVLFADGLEWDYSGQFVLYDAKNIIEGSFGDDITWWDIGIIKVWDNKTNAWGDGTIQKLFNQLNENISIGNPAFTKNTGNIIAFDVIDTEDDTYAIFGKNTVTGKSDEITSTTQIGFPNYSNKDDKLIYDATNTSGDEVLAIIDLGADKISGSGSPTVLINDAKWGTWYAQGTRSLLSSAKDILSFGFPYLNPPPTAQFSGNTITVNVPKGTNITNMSPTFVLSLNAEASISGTSQVSGVSIRNFINPVTYTIRAEDGSTRNYTVVVNVVSGINQKEIHPIHIYPNPAHDFITIDGPVRSYVIMDMSGRKLLEEKGNQIDIRLLANGIYTLNAELFTGERIYLRLVKE